MSDDAEGNSMGQPASRRRVIDLNQYARQDEPMPQQARPQPVSAAVEAFRDAMASAGLGRPEIVADGGLHRFDTPDEPTAKRKGSGWYIFYHDNIPSGAFGSWAHDISETWSLRANYEMSGVEIEAVRERWRQAREVREATRLQLAAEAARIAAEMWAETPDAASNHPYLAKKQVGAFGVKAKPGGALLVAMWSKEGSIVGLQRIFPDGTKRYLSGVAKEGAFGWIEGDQGAVYIAEGYATAASVHMATGHGVAIAFDAGNLEPVAKAVKEVFPQAKLILAADNDRWTKKQDGTPWNVGIEKAQRAAHAVGASVVWPDFRDLSTKPTDFNDLHVLEGIDAVRAQARGYSVNVREWTVSRLQGKAVPVREWLVDQTIPMDSAMLLAAPGGTGKGMTLLDLAIKVAIGPTPGIDLNASAGFFGHEIKTYGPVVYLAAEDDLDEVHRRISTLYGGYPENLYVLCLPDMDGIKAMVIDGREGVKVTVWWEEIVAQLLIIMPRLFIMDPLACFVWAELNDRQVGAFVMGTLAHLAKKLHAAVVVAHHMNKLKNGIRDLDHAKSEISGSAGFVDHGRGSIVLWPEEEPEAKKRCRQLGIEYARGKIIRGGLAKNNFIGDNEEKVFVRNESGLLVPLDHAAKMIQAQKQNELLDLLEKAIAHAAAQGHPFQHQGENGLHRKRERLPKALRELGRDSIEFLGRRLLDDKRIDKYRPGKGSKAEKWLDVPGGPFALGVGELMPGEFEMLPD